MSKKKRVDTKHWMHGVCHLNIVSVYTKPQDDSPMVSQMLFGETFTILEKRNKWWIKVNTSICNIIGWVKSNQVQLTEEKMFEKLSENPAIALEICHPLFNDETSKSIVMGSALPCYDGISCTMPDGKYVYNGQAALNDSLEKSQDLLIKIARRYLHSPELVGGRSPFGIDAGALVQHIFKFFDISLPRMPQEQYMLGEIVDFVELAKEGDLAFCEDSDHHIHHVGLIVGDKKILHVYGSVRIDKFDHHGFYNTDLCKYTHKLRIIKRIF